jgi:uncharacterized protein with ParB-like and HNH nuclease domain
MDVMTTFSSDKESLHEILKATSAGRYQLPEFQRGWVWDDAHITSLLASVSLSYPIGAVMMLRPALLPMASTCAKIGRESTIPTVTRSKKAVKMRFMRRKYCSPSVPTSCCK